MTVNVKKMKPVEMVRFLNSTELGTVISAAMVYRHFAEAGYRIASTEDSRCLSFYRYADAPDGAPLQLRLLPSGGLLSQSTPLWRHFCWDDPHTCRP